MKLITFLGPSGGQRVGALVGSAVVDLAAAAPLVFEDADDLRLDMLGLLRGDEQIGLDVARAAEIVMAVVEQAGYQEDMELDELVEATGLGDELHSSLSIGGAAMLLPVSAVRMLAPLPRPASLRDFYSFEEHVAAANRMRGRPVPPAWYDMPVFYFSNHGAIYGPEVEIPRPRTRALDYELELACVIGREGRDISEFEAEYYIAGFMIMNDWSARDVQLEEMSVGLGPAKGKDFATSLGPWLVTTDELEPYALEAGRYDLQMVARVNGLERSRGNASAMHYTFAQLVAHASRDCTLYPGDVLGSGTVGTGCLLELTEGQGPYLDPGDVVELEITGLGVLRNTVSVEI